MENQKSGKNRNNIKTGILVEIVEKHNQRNGELTEGFVKRILTNSKTHPHGIKVMLQTGEVGRVQHILDEEEE
ncbi:MAG: YwbE family protein [Saprospiraceae bacterium]|nr:YwbE family protein [Saprospiraceae bacterium]